MGMSSMPGKPLTMEIKGAESHRGSVPKTVTVNDSEIREALSESVSNYCECDPHGTGAHAARAFR